MVALHYQLSQVEHESFLETRCNGSKASRNDIYQDGILITGTRVVAATVVGVTVTEIVFELDDSDFAVLT